MIYCLCRIEESFVVVMENSFSVVVEGGRPWGFTLQGGLEFRAPIRVGKVSWGEREGERGGSEGSEGRDISTGQRKC